MALGRFPPEPRVILRATRRVEELETSLRRHDSNQKKAIADETKKYQDTAERFPAIGGG